MKKITLDASALANLRSVAEHVEVCDSEGRIVGYFRPSIYAGEIVPEFDEAELNRRSLETGGYTTAQVLEHLRQLGEQ